MIILFWLLLYSADTKTFTHKNIKYNTATSRTTWKSEDGDTVCIARWRYYLSLQCWCWLNLFLTHKRSLFYVHHAIIYCHIHYEHYILLFKHVNYYSFVAESRVYSGDIYETGRDWYRQGAIHRWYLRSGAVAWASSRFANEQGNCSPIIIKFINLFIFTFSRWCQISSLRSISSFPHSVICWLLCVSGCALVLNVRIDW